MAATTAGLSQALGLPVSRGYFEALAGLSTSDGFWSHAELGYRPLAHLALFTQGGFQSGAFQVAAGVRGEF